MKNTENEFEYKGRIYVAVDSDGVGCDGCAFARDIEVVWGCGMFSCLANDRSDHRRVKFKEKSQ